MITCPKGICELLSGFYAFQMLLHLHCHFSPLHFRAVLHAVELTPMTMIWYNSAIDGKIYFEIIRTHSMQKSLNFANDLALTSVKTTTIKKEQDCIRQLDLEDLLTVKLSCVV